MSLPSKIHVEIVTPERRVLARDVDEVVLPGALGSFGVLPGHAPLLAALGPGIAYVREGAHNDVMAISGGFAEVGPDKVTVLAETCEHAGEIDKERAKARLAELQKQIGMQLPPEEAEILSRRMAKQQARVEASQKA